ncbi:flagellin flab1 [hydrocarbon metagenome]|uniref:Flagellin flab1 n=1 Tax=hydrocarbon metagenome TaxID=938273 RepID=A0A0W8F0V0_9ZZZZ
MRKFRNNEEAFTGLEAAIVLIAFVVVAAVFSYVVLGAGFFTTQKSQEVVYAGVGSAASNIVVKGDVYGISTTTPAKIIYMQFDLGLAAGGYPIDIGQLNMIYSDTQHTPIHLAPVDADNPYEDDGIPGDGKWLIAKKAGSDVADDDHILKFGQTFTIRMNPINGVPTREAFHVEIKPEVGAALAISRTVPPSLQRTTLLT